MHHFGLSIEGELNKIKKNRTEKQEAYEARKRRAFLKLLGEEKAIEYAAPVATK